MNELTKTNFYTPFKADSLIRPFFSNIIKEFNTLPSFPFEYTDNSNILPKANIWEEDDKLITELDCAGIPSSELDISLQGNVLTISGEKNTQTDTTKGNFHLMERTSGKFTRSFNLPRSVDSSKIVATSKNGVVRIEVPKIEQSQKIEVKELAPD